VSIAAVIFQNFRSLYFIIPAFGSALFTGKQKAAPETGAALSLNECQLTC
jgi:hypothetical protein